MEKKEKKLRIVYTDGLDKKLDNVIEKFAKDNGWKFEGSGFTFATQKRDLIFYKEKDE